MRKRKRERAMIRLSREILKFKDLREMAQRINKKSNSTA